MKDLVIWEITAWQQIKSKNPWKMFGIRQINYAVLLAQEKESKKDLLKVFKELGYEL